ncbi:MAG: NapC/NirT family cytochrome c, partial [Anaerolineae bacterium]|nr:NapC/NirT family cytochrome c [Anaerolineae bacterium]
MAAWHKIGCLILLVIVAGSLILSRNEPRIAQGIIQGDSGPLVSAVVRVRASDDYVLTDAQGRFQLPVENMNAQLTAWAPGYYVGGDDLAAFLDSDSHTLTLHRHPTTDNADYAFISPVQNMNDPTACAHCHRERTGAANSAMPVDEWLLDAHSGAATNPRFLSLYNGTTLDGTSGIPTTFEFDSVQGVSVPLTANADDSAGVGFRLDFPEQSGSCAACHVPVLALQQLYSADPNHAEGVAAEGITCDFCHKIQDVRLRPDGKPNPGLPGVLSLEFLRPRAGEQVFIGPFDDTPGEDIYAPLQNESQVCAACHSGRFWDVPIYDSFGEWLSSPYSASQTCQDCHMPRTGATTFVQLPPDDPQTIPPRSPNTIFSHRMPGAADQQLLESTASIAVETQQMDGRLRVVVRVTNTGAGHHIPTDNPLRNLILLV